MSVSYDVAWAHNATNLSISKECPLSLKGLDCLLPLGAVHGADRKPSKVQLATLRLWRTWEKEKLTLFKLWLAYGTFLAGLLFFYTKLVVNDYIYRVVIALFLAGIGASVTYLTCCAFKQKTAWLILSTAILTCLAIYNILSSLSCWCCKSEQDFQRMCDVASTVKRIFDENGIKYWVCWGTLLGAYREARMPYQSMPWEHDFDICVMEDDWLLITDLLSNAPGLRLKNTNVDDGSVRSMVSRTYVDFYRYYYKDSEKLTLATRDGFGGREISTKRTLVEPMAAVQACNGLWPAPGRIVESIVDAYGEDFSTRHWPPGLTGFMCSLRTDCPLAVKPT